MSSNFCEVTWRVCDMFQKEGYMLIKLKKCVHQQIIKNLVNRIYFKQLDLARNMYFFKKNLRTRDVVIKIELCILKLADCIDYTPDNAPTPNI